VGGDWWFAVVLLVEGWALLVWEAELEVGERWGGGVKAEAGWWVET